MIKVTTSTITSSPPTMIITSMGMAIPEGASLPAAAGGVEGVLAGAAGAVGVTGMVGVTGASGDTGAAGVTGAGVTLPKRA